MNAELQAAIARLEYVARDEDIPPGLSVGAKLTDDVAAVLAALSSPPTDDEAARWETFNAMRRLDDEIYGTPPTDDVREALAREIEPAAWTGVRSDPDPTFYVDDPEARAIYEGFFYEGQRDRRAPSLAIADRLLSSSEFEVHPRGPVPTPEQWGAQMDVERARQVEHGYDDAHDAEKGIAHLLNWAIDYARRGNNLAAATMVRCALRLERGPVTEPCEWCPEQHTGFAEWQGDGLAHPSCAREGHGSNFEPVREPVTDAQVESAAEKFAASILVPEREARLAQSAFTAGVEWRERAARDARS